MKPICSNYFEANYRDGDGEGRCLKTKALTLCPYKGDKNKCYQSWTSEKEEKIMKTANDYTVAIGQEIRQTVVDNDVETKYCPFCFDINTGVFRVCMKEKCMAYKSGSCARIG